MLTHCSSGHLHSLNEVLKSPEVLAVIKDKDSASETRYIDKLFERPRKDNGRAWYGRYGVRPVERVVLEGPVG